MWRTTSILIGTILILITLGIVMVASTSSYHGELLFGDQHHFLKRQMVWLVLGVSACVLERHDTYSEEDYPDVESVMMTLRKRISYLHQHREVSALRDQLKHEPYRHHSAPEPECAWETRSMLTYRLWVIRWVTVLAEEPPTKPDNR